MTCLIDKVREAMETDDEDPEKQSDRIIRTYESASPKTQQVLDDVFISLCGWSLRTLLRS